MARPKEFNPDEALDKAVELFWFKGYRATSIQDLVDHLGINRGSLYGTFGDKHALFLAALDRYQTQQTTLMLAVLEDTSYSAKEAIQKLFNDVVHEAATSSQRRGCLMTNSAVELSPHDPETETRVAADLEQIEAAFYKAIVRGQAELEIPPDNDPQPLARYLTSCLQGLKVVSKIKADSRCLQDIVDMTLLALR